MAQTFAFERRTDDNLILMPVRVGNSIIELVLDTGASHSFVDFGILIKEGLRMSDSAGLIAVETANGIIMANRFFVKRFEAMGILKTDFEVTSYLFDDPESTFKGVIGLDFLENHEFCIDLKRNKITIR